MSDYRLLVCCFILIMIVSCRQAPLMPPYSAEKSVIADSAMVVSAHPLASAVGTEILSMGGNAVDAAIAIQFALAVVYPRAGNIGGGGFMVIRNQDGSTDALDYREKAPLEAYRDMYLDSAGNVIDTLSREGHLAVGVPGTVDGMVSAYQKYGSLEWSALLASAIRLARKGFAVSATEAERLNRYQADFREYNQSPNPFLRSQWREGDLLIQAELARSLELIRDLGREGFYAGETAQEIVAEMKSGNGIISLQDLKQYKSQWRTPVTGQYKNYRIISMPPSSSGGIALLQLLEMVEPYPIAEWGFQSSRTVHLMVEAERRAYADRADYLGDTDFFPVPVDSLLSETYLRQKIATFSMDSAMTSTNIFAGKPVSAPDRFETTHTSVVDQQGNAVSVTTTLNLNYGSKVWVDGAGFFLNDEMDDFSAKPGVANYFGLIGSEANAIQPQKRMLSSMTPTIVEKDSALFLVIGAPGGSTIITAVFQVILNVTEFGMGLEEAVNAGRFHHQWLPDEIKIERNTLADSVRMTLEQLGHQFSEVEYMAVIKAIQRLPDGRLHGVGDYRNPDDDAEGIGRE